MMHRLRSAVWVESSREMAKARAVVQAVSLAARLSRPSLAAVVVLMPCGFFVPISR